MKFLICLMMGLSATVRAAELTVMPQNGMPLVSASVDGVPCTLLVDTGASHTTLDLGFVTNRLASATIHDVELVGSTNVAMLPKFVEVCRLTVGEMTLATDGLMALDLAHLERAVGRKIDGILGMNHLRQKPCVISLRRQKLIWEPSAAEREGFHPVNVRDRGTTFEMPVVTPSGRPVALLIDTGSTFTFVDEAVWPAAEETLTMGTADVNVRGERSFRRGKAADIDCGGGRTLTLSPVLTPEKNRNQLGSDIFRTHDLLIEGASCFFRP